jgi:hypothetical protein
MTTNLIRYKSDLERLLTLGYALDLLITAVDPNARKPTVKEKKAMKGVSNFANSYQKWYTESCALIQQLFPGRLDEFVELYKSRAERPAVHAQSYFIQDWLLGTRAAINPATNKVFFADYAIITMQIRMQRSILAAVAGRFESSLFDIKTLVQADLFDSEIDAARELAKHGFGRSAGALAGVIVEKHLGEVCSNHAIAIKKTHPTISDFNDALKGGSLIDVPAWRGIQRLVDIRNLCDHSKGRDPTDDEVIELIDGVEKLTKTLF